MSRDVKIIILTSLPAQLWLVASAIIRLDLKAYGPPVMICLATLGLVGSFLVRRNVWWNNLIGGANAGLICAATFSLWKFLS